MTELHNALRLPTDELSTHGLCQGQPFPRIHDAPPEIERAFNPSDANSSRARLQQADEIALPYVENNIPRPQPRTNFLTLQAWEGVVTSVEEEVFSVRLMDLTGSEPDEEADIGYDEVSADERTLIRIGAVFLLYVGYAISEGGQRSRTSILRFRRLPVWTESELSGAKKAAQQQADTIRWS